MELDVSLIWKDPQLTYNNLNSDSVMNALQPSEVRQKTKAHPHLIRDPFNVFITV